MKHLITALTHPRSWGLDTFDRRDRALLLMAILWACVGYSLWQQPDYYPDDSHYPMEYLPPWVRVGIWWISAACALVAVWAPKSSDKWGFLALVIPPAFRAVAFTWGVALADTLLLSAVTWWCVTLLVYLLAAWPSPPRVPAPRDEVDG